MKTNRFFFVIVLLFAFICVTANAQEIVTTRATKIHIRIQVTDVLSDNGEVQQKIELKVPDTLKFHRNDIIKLKVHLNYRSSIDTIRYFRLSHIIFPNGPFGASAPVIIPPVSKDGNKSIESSINSREGYPFVFKNPLHFIADNNRLMLRLIQYDNEDDYLKDELGNRGTWLDPVTINVILIPGPVSVGNMGSDQFSIYPNPGDGYFTIKYNDLSIQNTPVQIEVFNRNGMKVSSSSFVSTKTSNSNVLHSLDLTYLKKGIYHCSIRSRGNTFIKTLIKK